MTGNRTRPRHRRRVNACCQSNFADEIKLRGTPAQIAEKYEQLEREAAGMKDLLLATSYSQHAHHWRCVQIEQGN